MNVNGAVVSSAELISWIEKSLEGQNLTSYEVSLTGKTEKGDGYIGEVVFASVDGSTKENGRKVLDLVIKHGKKNDHLRKTVPVKNAFEKEIHVYDKVFTAFRKFEYEKDIKNGFKSVPRCYKTLLLDNMEVLVLENLKKVGYELHNRKKSLNLYHAKAVLREYGKFHALSFALKDQKRDLFDSIANYNNDIFKEFMVDNSVRESFKFAVNGALDMLKEKNDTILHSKFNNFLVKPCDDMIWDLLNEDEPQSVITHGDCWNNNFMFKYEFTMDADSVVTSGELISWIEESVKGENFSHYEVNFTGTTDKCDGYGSEIVFARVEGSTKENERKILDLAIKHGKKNALLRKTLPFRFAFEKEIHIYDKVLPVFKNFEKAKNIEDGFDSVPKCYLALLLDNMEVLVFDNLRKLGYELHNRKKPLNLGHVKAVLREYGKLHALSFALKDQNEEKFFSIANYQNNWYKEFIGEGSMRESVISATEDALDMLKKKNLILFDKFKKFLVKNCNDMLYDLLSEEDPQCVITHGDCWNNNFMFKYENEDRTCPSKIAILDWQISSLKSPALDLSYFIYANSSKEVLDQFDELIKTYYTSFSTFLSQLGSDPEELFSFNDLKRHWKKYSHFGLIFMPMLLRFALCDKEQAPAFEDLREGEDVGAMMRIDIPDQDEYYKRLEAVVNHYFFYEF